MADNMNINTIPVVSTQVCNELVPLPKLETKLKTIISLLCDSVYDHLVYNVQENSSSQIYRRNLQDFLTEKQEEFYNTHIHTKYS